jgi:hypothetical protein
MKQFIVWQSMEVVYNWVINADTKEEAMKKLLNAELTVADSETFRTVGRDIKKIWAKNWDDVDDDEYEIEIKN